MNPRNIKEYMLYKHAARGNSHSTGISYILKLLNWEGADIGYFAAWAQVFKLLFGSSYDTLFRRSCIQFSYHYNSNQSNISSINKMSGFRKHDSPGYAYGRVYTRGPSHQDHQSRDSRGYSASQPDVTHVYVTPEHSNSPRNRRSSAQPDYSGMPPTRDYTYRPRSTQHYPRTEDSPSQYAPAHSSVTAHYTLAEQTNLDRERSFLAEQAQAWRTEQEYRERPSPRARSRSYLVPSEDIFLDEASPDHEFSSTSENHEPSERRRAEQGHYEATHRRYQPADPSREYPVPSGYYQRFPSASSHSYENHESQIPYGPSYNGTNDRAPPTSNPQNEYSASPPHRPRPAPRPGKLK